MQSVTIKALHHSTATRTKWAAYSTIVLNHKMYRRTSPTFSRVPRVPDQATVTKPRVPRNYRVDDCESFQEMNATMQLRGGNVLEAKAKHTA
jgi:hypothetical protein